MDNNKPYNEFDEQFNDLPLPGEEQSWQKMKQMLDEDDRNRKPLVPIFLKSCAGWGLALLLISTAAWFIVKPQRWWQDQKTEVEAETKPKQNVLNPDETVKSVPGENIHPAPGNTTAGNNTGPGVNANNITTNETIGQPTAGTGSTNSFTPNSTQKPKTGNAEVLKPTVTKKPGGDVSAMQPNERGTKTPVSDETKKKNSNDNDISGNGVDLTGTAVIANPPKTTAIEPGKKESSISTSNASEQNDTLVKKEGTLIKDSVPEKQQQTSTADTTAVVQKNENKSKKTKLVVSAGIGLQQQIPIGGQEAVPYDYYGRTGSLSDYIPSVYLRVGHENKWFVQGEFRYGAPQTLKDFQYSRQTIVDSQAMTVTTYRLKKTYYHQLPFSFNYYVLPNLTIGVGGIYNRFYGAVTEKEVKKTDLQTQVETLSRQIVNIQHFNDSFLYKTQVHALVQTEYHWKRFDFGLRYTKDIQPYIKYTQPDGKIDVKKNQTFQLLVRYRIWSSRTKFNG